MCDHGVGGCCHDPGHRCETSRSPLEEVPVIPMKKKVRDSASGRCWGTPPRSHLHMHRLPLWIVSASQVPPQFAWQYRAICLIPENSTSQEQVME